MVQDYRIYRDLDLDEVLEIYRADQMARGAGGPLNELRRQRGYRVDVAHELVKAAVKEGRALTAEERARVDLLTEEAQTLAAIIADGEAKRRRELEASAAIAPSYRPY
jgi:hypothetical protein